ncbi:unnamed protein product [Lampetra fluviatilis]
MADSTHLLLLLVVVLCGWSQGGSSALERCDHAELGEVAPNATALAALGATALGAAQGDCAQICCDMNTAGRPPCTLAVEVSAAWGEGGGSSPCLLYSCPSDAACPLVPAPGSRATGVRHRKSTSGAVPQSTAMLDSATTQEGGVGGDGARNGLPAEGGGPTEAGGPMGGDAGALVACTFFGVVLVVAALGILGRKAVMSYRRRDYTRADFLINGIYN